jgi:hypothetical protein
VMRESLMLLTAAVIVVTAPVATNAGGRVDRSNSATQVTIRVAAHEVTCRGREWRAVGYAGCTQDG